MFISKKRWNEMERRVSALEKECFPEVSHLSQMKAALEAALRSHVRQSEPVPPIVISQEQFEKITSLIRKGNSLS